MLKHIIKSKISIILLLTIFILVSLGIFAFGNKALAQSCAEDKNGVPVCSNGFRLQVGIPGLTNSCEYMSVSYSGGERIETPKRLYCVAGFPEYIKTIYNMFIGIVGILAVIMIMLGGFQWLLAAGNAQRIAGAKTTIMSAVLGLVLALTSYTILSIVNPEVIDLNIPALSIKSSDGPTVGLCTKRLEPILRGDEKDGPQCGKNYIITKLGDSGQDDYCAGFIYSKIGTNDVKLDFCYFDNHATSILQAILIGDSSPDGFGSIIWNSSNVWPCGELHAYHLEKTGNTQYWLGNKCSENDEYCVITGGDGNVNFTKSKKDLVKLTGEMEVGTVSWECKLNEFE